jgi:hypothetical protein
MKRLLILAALLPLAACANRPIDAYDVCEAALDGLADPMYAKHKQCQDDVAGASFTAGHAAAKKYRDIPR